MSEHNKPKVAPEHAVCGVCEISAKIDELYFCDYCGRWFCAGCLDEHDCEPEDAEDQR